MYQHGVLPRLLWPLLVYEVPMMTVEALENHQPVSLEVLGAPSSLCSTKLQLPIIGLSEEFKVTRAREVMMYQDSSDVKVASAGMFVKTKRKWKA